MCHVTVDQRLLETFRHLSSLGSRVEALSRDISNPLMNYGPRYSMMPPMMNMNAGPVPVPVPPYPVPYPVHHRPPVMMPPMYNDNRTWQQ